MSSWLLKSQDKKFEYLNNFANISGYIISVFEFYSIHTGHLRTLNQLLSSMSFHNVLRIYYMAQCYQYFFGFINYTNTWLRLFSIIDVREFSRYDKLILVTSVISLYKVQDSVIQ